MSNNDNAFKITRSHDCWDESLYADTILLTQEKWFDVWDGGRFKVRWCNHPTAKGMVQSTRVIMMT